MKFFVFKKNLESIQKCVHKEIKIYYDTERNKQILLPVDQELSFEMEINVYFDMTDFEFEHQFLTPEFVFEEISAEIKRMQI